METPSKSALQKLLCTARNVRSRVLFNRLRRYCRGTIIDIGGWDFYLSAKRQGVRCNRWITLELSPQKVFALDDPAFACVIGDGCHAAFRNNCCDTALSIHVLEHVFEPITMFHELVRILKPGGYGIVVIPQTAVLHGIPAHFQNLTIYWLREMCRRAGVGIVEHIPIGGFWSTTASRMFYFFLQSTRRPEYSATEFQRNVLFYLLWPFMAIWALINLVVCMAFSLSDLTEEPNNHLLVFQKPP